MKIGIIGNYGATNIGDDAILEAILGTLKGHEVTVFSANPEETAARFGVTAVPLFPLGFRSLFRHGFSRSIQAMKSLDAVIFGGGGLFQDTVLYACFLWSWQVHWVKKYGKPLFIYGTGVGPLKTKTGRRLTRSVYDYATAITVRDSGSKILLSEIGVPKEKIQVTADPVFLFTPKPLKRKRTKNLILVSLRPVAKFTSRIIAFMSEYLLFLKRTHNAELVFVVMQQIREHDMQVIEPIRKKVEGQVVVPRDLNDLMQLMSRAEMVIGMRYHFLIAALLTATPSLAIGYSPKVDSLYQGTPLHEFLVPLSELQDYFVEAKLNELQATTASVQTYEGLRAMELRELAQKNVTMFEAFLNEIVRNLKKS